MSLITIVYFDDNLDLDLLYDDLTEITQTQDSPKREALDPEEQVIIKATQVSHTPQRPGIVMTCAIIGKLYEEDTFSDTGEPEDVECWIEVEFYTQVSVLAPAETHVSYLMALDARGYSFRWLNSYDKKLYDSSDFDALIDFCALGELHYRQ